MKHWFTTEQLDKDTFVISENRHWEETHCYLLVGAYRSLLIDTGLGIGDILAEVRKCADEPVTAVATHAHWDHIGGHGYFSEFYVHEEEESWLKGGFPLPVEAVRKMIASCRELPAGYDVTAYEIFQGTPAKILKGGEVLDIGGRTVEVLHTPGHSPGHMCFWEPERGYLFTGDLVYQGTLYADYPSTDPAAYLASLGKITSLPVKKLFPAHHSLEVTPKLAERIKKEFERLQETGKLHHGSGTFFYEDWSVRL